MHLSNSQFSRSGHFHEEHFFQISRSGDFFKNLRINPEIKNTACEYIVLNQQMGAINTRLLNNSQQSTFATICYEAPTQIYVAPSATFEVSIPVLFSYI